MSLGYEAVLLGLKASLSSRGSTSMDVMMFGVVRRHSSGEGEEFRMELWAVRTGILVTEELRKATKVRWSD